MPKRSVRSIDRWPNARSDAAITAVGGSLLLIATAIAVASFQHYALAVEGQARQALLARAESRRAQVELLLGARRADVEMLATRIETLPVKRIGEPGFLAPQASAALSRILRQTEISYTYRDVGLLDVRGTIIRSLAGGTGRPLEASALRAILADGRTRLVDAPRDASGARTFTIARPVSSLGAAADGVVYVRLGFNDGLPSSGGPSSTDNTLLVRRAGQTLDYLSARPDPQPGQRHAPTAALAPTDRSLAAQVLASAETTPVAGLDDRNNYVVGATTPVAGTDWYVLVTAAATEAGAPVAAVRLAGLAICGALVTFLLIGTRLLWRAKQADVLDARIVADESYRAAIDASMDGYLVADDTGVILKANDALLRMLRYSRDDLIGCRLQDIQAQTPPELYDEQLLAVRASGEARRQTCWRRADGTLVDLAVSLVYVGDADGGLFHGFVHDIGPELATRRHIERLGAFYRFLSQANAAIFNLSDPQEILDAVCHAAVNNAGFALVWAGFLESGTDAMKPSSIYGDAADYMRTLQITIDPVLPTSRGPTRLCMIERRIVSISDFQHDPRTEPWHAKGRRHGIRSSAAVPIVVDGAAVAALTFYSREPDYFDSELRGLLEETAHNVSLALQAVFAERERLAAENSSRDSEERFQRVFDSSPIPTQIWSLQDRTLRSVNRAHDLLLGYSREDIAEPSRWRATVFPDAGYSDAVRAGFERNIRRASAGRSGAVIESDELKVRCKDGAERVMRAYLTLVAGDILVQWQDLTQIKRQQADLAEGERRFRGMIEQTLSGVYVAVAGRIVYVNPRLEAVLGYAHSELIGMDPLALVDEERRDQADLLRGRLQAGHAGISGSLEVRRKDGAPIVIGVYATAGSWDGEPADIVMVQDVTEAQRSAEQIAAYVSRLQSTMRGTMRAVAKMIDLRDPYTAGHERRVGILAGEIAAELGCSDEACEQLQVIGLVHDIGKIAIPTEILSKSSKLTTLEYSLVKEHAENGYDILKDVDFPIPIAEIIRQHHEHIDGSGYPRGLKGDEIRLEARIIAVADVIEAMGSHRPYRASLGVQAALTEIERFRGTWYDPQVVDAALRLMRRRSLLLPP